MAMDCEVEIDYYSLSSKVALLKESELANPNISNIASHVDEVVNIESHESVFNNDMQTMSRIIFSQMLVSMGLTKTDIEDWDIEEDDFEFSDLEIEDSESEDDEFDLAEYLKPVCRNMTRDDADYLLKGLRMAGHKNLPLNKYLLLETPTTTKINPCDEGEYLHYGLKTALQDMRNRKVSLPKKLFIDIGIDGVPLSKSGKRKAWPIIGRLKNVPFVSPFLIGVYHGTSNPTSPVTFLRPLVGKLKQHETKLLQLSNNESYEIKVNNFICDTPGRCLVTFSVYYNAINGCGRCEIVGKYEAKMKFLQGVAEFRTDRSFREKRKPSHHKGTSPLEELNIDMIKSFPLDYMHLVCLSITKLLLWLWFKSKFPLLKPSGMKFLSDSILDLGKYLFKEFNRKTYALSDLGRWKATVFRTFLLYVGPIVLQGQLRKKYVDNFMLLNCAIRILCHPVECIRNNVEAKDLLS